MVNVWSKEVQEGPVGQKGTKGIYMWSKEVYVGFKGVSGGLRGFGGFKEGSKRG